jgi:hypothetical protein
VSEPIDLDALDAADADRSQGPFYWARTSALVSGTMVDWFRLVTIGGRPVLTTKYPGRPADRAAIVRAVNALDPLCQLARAALALVNSGADVPQELLEAAAKFKQFDPPRVPVVCPGCYALDDEPHAGDCIDAELERDREDAYARGDRLDDGDADQEDESC